MVQDGYKLTYFWMQGSYLRIQEVIASNGDFLKFWFEPEVGKIDYKFVFFFIETPIFLWQIWILRQKTRNFYEKFFFVTRPLWL